MLPPNWTKYTTVDGRDYYHNKETNVTQWTVPVILPDIGASKTISLSQEPRGPMQSSPIVDSKSGSFSSWYPLSMQDVYEGFDISSNHVFYRLSLVFFPWKSSNLNAFKTKIDLYSPFWISTTLIFLLAMMGNFSRWLISKEATPYFTNYSLAWTATSLVYGLLFVVPLLISVGGRWLFGKSDSVEGRHFPIFYSILGYSFLVLVPSTFLVACITSFYFRIFVAVISLIVAGNFFVIFLWKVPSENIQGNFRMMILGLCEGCHVIVWFVFFWKFLASIPKT